MKKYIALIMIPMFMLPAVSSAQTTDAVREQLVASLWQVIQLLEQQIALLQQQLAIAKAQQASAPQPVYVSPAPVQTTPAPIVPPVSSGATEPVNPLSCTLSATATLDAAYWMQTYGANPPTAYDPVQFSWSFTPGATGNIRDTGSSNTVKLGTNSNSASAPLSQQIPRISGSGFVVDSHPFHRTYELTVTQNSFTATCDTTIDVQ